MIRAIAAALAALAVLGCSEGDEAATAPNANTVRLSTDHPDTNAPAIAAFFRATCIDAGGDAGAFASALQASGWENELAQPASEAMPIAAWQLDNGELVRSELSLAPGSNFVDCQLTLDAAAAPGLERMRDALRPMIGHPSRREISAGPPTAKWQWRPGPREERELTIELAAAARGGGAAAARRGLEIHLRATEGDPPQAPAGADNVQ